MNLSCRRRICVVLWLAVVAAIFQARIGFAQTFTWKGGSGTWSDSNNWSSSTGGFPNGASGTGNYARFNASPGTVSIVTSATTMYTYLDSAGWTLQGTGTLRAGWAGQPSFFSIGSGTNTIDVAMAFPNTNMGISVGSGNTLVLSSPNMSVSSATIWAQSSSRTAAQTADNGTISFPNAWGSTSPATFAVRGSSVLIGNANSLGSSGTLAFGDAGSASGLYAGLYTTAGLTFARPIVLRSSTLATSGGQSAGNANNQLGLINVTVGGRQTVGATTYSGNIMLNDQAIALTSANTDGNAVTFSGTISGSGTRGVTKIGAGTVVLTAANTYTGTTTIDAGTLQIGGGGLTGSITNTSPVNVASGATLAFSRSDSVSYGGTISGAGGIAQRGGGLVTLSAASAYAGPTTIASGTLKLAAGGSFANSSGIIVGGSGSSGVALDLTDKSTFGIGATQTLMGGGSVNLGASTLLTVSGTFSPGNSPGLFTYSSGTTLLAGTTLMEILGTSRAMSPSHGDGFYDAVNVMNGGVLDFGDSILTLSFDSLFNVGDTFQLFQALDTASLVGNFGSVIVTGSYYTNLTWTKSGSLWESTPAIGGESLSFNAATGLLSVAIAVPEPGSLALAGIGMAVARWVVARRRRRVRGFTRP